MLSPIRSGAFSGVGEEVGEGSGVGVGVSFASEVTSAEGRDGSAVAGSPGSGAHAAGRQNTSSESKTVLGIGKGA